MTGQSARKAPKKFSVHDLVVTIKAVPLIGINRNIPALTFGSLTRVNEELRLAAFRLPNGGEVWVDFDCIAHVAQEAKCPLAGQENRLPRDVATIRALAVNHMTLAFEAAMRRLVELEAENATIRTAIRAFQAEVAHAYKEG